jgi:N-sulfoglucosamine sulfohydrolase
MVALVDPHRPFDEDAPARSVDPAAVRVPGSLWDAPGTREELAGYYDCIARLDATVGELLAALEASGHARDTLVIFTADNGASFPFAKSTLYEAGVRMPFLVHGPGVARGARSELVSLLDLLPTALEMFGAAPVACDGRSLTGVMRGPDPEPRAALVTMQTENNRESGRPARALHGPRFKYIRNFGEDSATVSNVVGHSMTWSSGRELARSDPEVAARMRAYLYREVEELYDLATDPLELRDLARVPEYAATCAALRGDLRAWMERNADPLLAEWPT